MSSSPSPQDVILAIIKRRSRAILNNERRRLFAINKCLEGNGTITFTVTPRSTWGAKNDIFVPVTSKDLQKAINEAAELYRDQNNTNNYTNIGWSIQCNFETNTRKISIPLQPQQFSNLLPGGTAEIYADGYGWVQTM